MKRISARSCSIFAFAATAITARAQTPVGTAFTYQGQLKQSGAPVNGAVNFRFSLWDAAGSGSPPSGGNQIGATQQITNVPISNGLFTVTLNDTGQFGSTAFGGQARWLQVEVCSDSSCATRTILSPRQPITTTPYAEFANLAAAPWMPATGSGAIAYTAGNVGIGTTAPISKLHLDSNSNANIDLVLNSGLTGMRYSAVDFFDRGTNRWGMGKDDHNNFYIDETGVARRLHIQPGGGIGIGTTIPLANLDVRGTFAVTNSASGGIAVDGYASVADNSLSVGVLGEADGASGTGVFGQNDASGATGYGVHGQCTSASAWAVFASGRFGASGTKSFRIDHPDDPLNKYLMHYCTEGPEPLNVYSGSIRTDDDGYAQVILPAYFDSINRDPRIQLTVIDEANTDTFVLAKVIQRVRDHAFKIRTSAPQVEVFWEVKAVRNDAWVQRYGAPVEVEKPAAEKGKYQHPELYGAPAGMGTNYRTTAHGRAEQARPK